MINTIVVAQLTFLPLVIIFGIMGSMLNKKKYLQKMNW